MAIYKKINGAIVRSAIGDKHLNDKAVEIESIMSGVTEEDIATQVYVIDDYLIKDGKLYKVIQNITVGTPFSEDINIKETTLGEELSALKKSGADAKSALASAITAKGQSTASDASFDTMVTNIGNIHYGDGDAAAGNVLSGKTFMNSAGGSELQTGTMPNKGGSTQAATGTIASSKLNVAIPVSGYYNTSSKLTVDVGTATKAQVLSGKTFTSTAGVKASGSMADYSNNVQTITCNANTGTQTYNGLANGYHTSIKVDQTAPYNAGKAAGGGYLAAEWLRYSADRTENASTSEREVPLIGYNRVTKSGNTITISEAGNYMIVGYALHSPQDAVNTTTIRCYINGTLTKRASMNYEGPNAYGLLRHDFTATSGTTVRFTFISDSSSVHGNFGGYAALIKLT